jgi:uncharacterized protein YndB with AHSA1/START domain
LAAIETDEFLAHPPERVWRALTDPAMLGEWLMPNDFEPRVGHRFTFRTQPIEAAGFDGVVTCEVLEIDPPRRLRISWRGGPGVDTTVTWELAAEGRGTRLFLTHDGFDDTDPAQRNVMRILGGGWRGLLLERLSKVLDAAAAS